MIFKRNKSHLSFIKENRRQILDKLMAQIDVTLLQDNIVEKAEAQKSWALSSYGKTSEINKELTAKIKDLEAEKEELKIDNALLRIKVAQNYSDIENHSKIIRMRIKQVANLKKQISELLKKHNQ